MKEIINKIIFVLLSSLILIGALCFIIKKPVSFSENENRYLSTFPNITLSKLAEGKLTSDIENYINDQFPFRDNLVGVKTQIEVLFGKTKINDIYISKDDYLIPVFNKKNSFDKIIKTLNDFNSKVKIPVDLMIAPNAIEIYSEKLPITNEMNDGIKEIENIYQIYSGNSINIHEHFKRIKDEVDLYYRTDHHWTTHGAFYAYNEYLKANNKPIKSLQDYNVILASEEFYGTSYSKANYYSIKPDDLYLYEDNRDYYVNYVIEDVYADSLYNKEYLNKKDKYSVFLDNNHALIEIDNLENFSSENLLLIKNSYGNSFAPFVAADYDKLSIIDLRYYKEEVSQYIIDNNITKVLILYDINGIYTDASIYRLR